VQRGAQAVRKPERIEDEHGFVMIASVRTYGDTIHSFIQRNNYHGPFLPKFIAVTAIDPLVSAL
jgi:4-hydroxyphenylpyruvate dioxygenase